MLPAEITPEIMVALLHRQNQGRHPVDFGFEIRTESELPPEGRKRMMKAREEDSRYFEGAKWGGPTVREQSRTPRAALSGKEVNSQGTKILHEESLYWSRRTKGETLAVLVLADPRARIILFHFLISCTGVFPLSLSSIAEISTQEPSRSARSA